MDFWCKPVLMLQKVTKCSVSSKSHYIFVTHSQYKYTNGQKDRFSVADAQKLSEKYAESCKKLQPSPEPEMLS